MNKIRIISKPTKVVDENKVAYRYKAKVDLAISERDREQQSIHIANTEHFNKALDTLDKMTVEEVKASLKSMDIPH
jgi:hypothetical protein